MLSGFFLFCQVYKIKEMEQAQSLLPFSKQGDMWEAYLDEHIMLKSVNRIEDIRYK